MSNKRKLLIIGSSSGSKEFVIEAKRQGIYTIVTDYLDVKDSEAKQIANEYWMISTGEVDVLEAKCREKKVDALISGASAFNISVMMELCSRLNLPCYCNREAWEYTVNKRKFKDICSSVGVPVAKDYYVSIEPTKEELEKIKYPVVVKPIDLSANRGMSYCYNENELLEACEKARAISKSETIIVERMLNGVEYGAHYALADGNANMFDFVAMIHQPEYPSNCYSVTTNNTNNLNKFLLEINQKMIAALNKMGVKDGIAWIEMILDEDGSFYVLEMGYRISGDMIALVQKNTCNFNVYKWLLDIAMGKKHSKVDLPVAQKKLYERCGCCYILWSREDGTVTSIEGLEKIVHYPTINVQTILKVGSKVKKHQYLVVITFDVDNCEQMCEMIEKINKILYIYNETENNVIYFNDFNHLYKLDSEGRLEK